MKLDGNKKAPMTRSALKENVQAQCNTFPMDAEEFGLYLRQLRRAKGLTLLDVAENIAISRAYLGHIENGRRGIPSPELIRSLSGALGCTHIGMMIKAGYVSEEEVLGFIHQKDHIGFGD